jgi:hypothetical protein
MGVLSAVVGGYLVHRLVEGTVPIAFPSRRGVETGIVAIVFAASVGVAARLGHSGDAIKPIMIAAACVALAGATLWAVHRFASKHALPCLSIVAVLTTGDLRLNNGPK